MSNTPPPYYPPPSPPRKRSAVAWFAAACMAAAVTGGGVAIATKDGGGDSFTDPAACKTALDKQYRDVMADGAKGPERPAPPACEGLDGKTLERITGEVVAAYLDSEQADKDMEDILKEELGSTPSGGVSSECRTWIKAELLDNSEEIDATPGYEACGDLSEDELQAAIDSVTAELSAEITPEP